MRHSHQHYDSDSYPSNYLMEPIEISLQQDYSNFEVIVSDNASTDDTMDRLQKHLADAHFRYYRNEKNFGSGWIYEKFLYEYAPDGFGLNLAGNDYFVHPQHLTKAMQIIKYVMFEPCFLGPFPVWRCTR